MPKGRSVDPMWKMMTSSMSPPSKLPALTLADVHKHRVEGDLWIALRGKVYDCTKFLKFHPGGVGSLLKVAGKDGTQAFDKFHSWVDLDDILSCCVVGILQTESEKVAEDGDDEADLSEVWELLDESGTGHTTLGQLRTFLE
eukprot:EG_transcript_36698